MSVHIQPGTSASGTDVREGVEPGDHVGLHAQRSPASVRMYALHVRTRESLTDPVSLVLDRLGDVLVGDAAARTGRVSACTNGRCRHLSICRDLTHPQCLQDPGKTYQLDRGTSSADEKEEITHLQWIWGVSCRPDWTGAKRRESQWPTFRMSLDDACSTRPADTTTLTKSSSRRVRGWTDAYRVGNLTVKVGVPPVSSSPPFAGRALPRLETFFSRQRERQREESQD